jgi:hypothetical protein
MEPSEGARRSWSKSPMGCASGGLAWTRASSRGDLGSIAPCTKLWGRKGPDNGLRVNDDLSVRGGRRLPGDPEGASYTRKQDTWRPQRPHRWSLHAPCWHLQWSPEGTRKPYSMRMHYLATSRMPDLSRPLGRDVREDGRDEGECEGKAGIPLAPTKSTANVPLLRAIDGVLEIHLPCPAVTLCTPSVPYHLPL